MNIQRKNSAHHFRMQSEREQTLVANFSECKTTLTLTTPLFRANMSCAVTTIFSSLDFLSLSISMAKLSRLVAATFSCLALLSSSVSTAKLSCSTTFSSLRFLSNSLSSPRFNLLKVAGRCFLWFSVFLCSRLILSLSFL